MDYPTKPVRVITATSAGGTSDIFIRALGEEFQKRTGQPLIVENRSGGGMNIGGKACADAPNDGYTICILPNETLTLNQFAYKRLTYNPATDFAPITKPVLQHAGRGRRRRAHLKLLAELATASKAKPGTLSYSALSIPLQLFMEEWKKTSGADIVGVPARGGADIVNGVLSGTIPVAIVGIANWLPHIRCGAVVALAVNSLNDLRSCPTFRRSPSWVFPTRPRCTSASSRPPGPPPTSSKSCSPSSRRSATILSSASAV